MTQERSEKELAVLAAARMLAALQNNQEAGSRQEAAVNANEAAKKAAFEEADFELARADLAYAAARFTSMDCKRRAAAMEVEWMEKYSASEDARRDLWRLAHSGDEELILSTARDYGAKLEIFWEIRSVKGELEEKQRAAEQALKDAGEERKAAVQKRGRAKADLEAAAQERETFYRTLKYVCIFGGERELADAAHDLTGTGDKHCAYSYMDTKDLGLTFPDELEVVELPGEAPSMHGRRRIPAELP